MAQEMLALSEHEITEASVNYVDCLALSPNSQVLIITDLVPQEISQSDPNVEIRTKLSGIIESQLKASHSVTTIQFDGSMSRNEIESKTNQAIKELQELGGTEGNTDLTIVYMGDAWNNRRGIYDAATTAGENRKVRVAGSLGFSTGDCRVMSQMGPEQRRIIEDTNDYFENFFQEHPQGKFTLVTTDAEGQQYRMNIDYDTTPSPFETELGRFDPEHEILKRDYSYVNIPGGEKFGCPFPFQNTEGQFTAEGVHFTVEKGMIIRTEIINPSLIVAESSQTELMRIIQEGGSLPVAELGLGFYAMAGIQTYSDSSVLSREKQGPHIGVGNDPNGKSPEGETLKELSGDFYHTDFVMSTDVKILFTDPETQETSLFYPPPQATL